MVRLIDAVLLLPFAVALQSDDASTHRVAIIGAGAGGSSAAYHLAQYAASANLRTNITVFERNGYVGGRTTTVNVWNTSGFPVELGGSIFVEVNQIMVEAMKNFNLSTKSNDVAAQLAMPDLGIWNGEEFVIITRNEDGWWDKAKLLWRYGTAPIWTNRLMQSAVGKFLDMYKAPLFPWSSLSEVVEKAGLLEVTGVTGDQYLKKNGIGDLFAREIIQASTRVNYASNLPYIHGLETMVCMATNGAMQIDGGNWQIFANMLNASSAAVHLKNTVARISKQHDKTYQLTTTNGHNSTFDEIILAAPLQFADLIIDPAPSYIPDEIPYTKLHTTLFASPHRLDPAAFKLGPDASVPQYVLTTLPPTEEPEDNAGSPGFYSISIHNALVNTRASPPRLEYIYKIFSPTRVTPKILSHLLGHTVSEDEAEYGAINGTVSWIYHKLWYSYPREYPRVTFEEIKLDEGLWYTSGIESFISTMETSALSGKNVARLVVDKWVDKEGRDSAFSLPDLGLTGEDKGEELWQEEV